MTKFAFKKKLLSSAVAVAMVSGVVVSQNVNAIHLAEDDIGQVLLAPFYYADGYTTKFAIVNSRTDAAVKVKVVIRSAGHSAELLDFICYMTPADVCRFEIMTDADGLTYLTSTDDSVKQDDAVPPKFASQVAVKQPLNLTRMNAIDPNDSPRMGHVEIIGVYGAQGVVQTAPVWGGVQQSQAPVQVRRTMPKPDVARIFDTPRNAGRAISLAAMYGAGQYSLTLNGMNGAEAPTMAIGRLVNGVCSTTPGNDGVVTVPCRGGAVQVDVANIRSTDPRVVRLTGSIEIVRNDHSDRMGYKIPALAGEIWDQVDPAFFVWENGVTHPVVLGLPWSGTLAPGITAGTLAGLRWTPATPYTTPASLLTNPPTSGPHFDGRVIGFDDFDADISAETRIGEGMGVGGANNTLEIEHALAASNLKNTFERAGVDNRQTQLVVTFPTKYVHRGWDVCNTYLQEQVATGRMTTGTASITYTPPFTPQGQIGYTLTAYDNQENSLTVTRSIVFSPRPVVQPQTLPAEVNYFVPGWPATYESGWFDMGLSQMAQPTGYSPQRGCQYTGVPALSLAHYYLGGTKNSWMVGNAHTPEMVNRQYREPAINLDY